jgi:hypothetical protein
MTMQSYSEDKSPANSHIPLVLRTYCGPFALFRQKIKESILEIEKNSPDRKFAGCPMESRAKS